jgi:hypothetical protein
MEKLATAREIGGFLRERKKYWLAPIVALLVFIGILIVLGQSSALGPFMYPLF